MDKILLLFLHMRDIRKNVSPKLIKHCTGRRHVGVPLRDTNMATGNQQLSFPTIREFIAWGTHKDQSNIYPWTRNVWIAKSQKIGTVFNP